jgi:peptide/nickel transport system substrate-binding protein
MYGRSWIGWFAAAVAVVVAASSCSLSSRDGGSAAATTTTQPRHGGKLSVGIETDLNGLDPTRNAWDPVSLEVANAIYDTLFAFDVHGEPRSYALESADHDASYLTWTLRLRPGVIFHNGRAATGDDLTRIVRAFRDSPVTGQAAQNIVDATTLDGLTTSIQMKRPWASFPATLTGQGGTLVPPEQLDDPYGHSHPIGTGPFKLQRWEQRTKFELVRNPDYWRRDAAGARLPYLDGVTFVVVPDIDQERDMLSRGEIDLFQTRLSTAASPLDDLASRGEILVEHDPGPTETSFVQMNVAKPPLDDVRIRRAMAYAFDVRDLASRFGWPQARLADTPVAPSNPFHQDVAFPRADPQRARQLVEDYRRTTGRAPQIALSTSFEPAMAQALAYAWSSVGIKTEVAVVDRQRALLTAVAGLYDAMLFAYDAATDIDSLYVFWHSSTVRPIGQVGLNYTRFADPVIDQALDEGRESSDPAIRRPAYERLQRRFAETVPYIWLARLDWVIARRPRVYDARNVTLPGGAVAAPFESGVFRLTETWLAPA